MGLITSSGTTVSFEWRRCLPEGTAWSPWCCQRPNAKRQSWWARPRRDASSWHRPCFYTQGWGSLCVPSRISACGPLWRKSQAEQTFRMASLAETLQMCQKKEPLSSAEQSKDERMRNARERVDHRWNWWIISGTDIIKVQHPLDSPCLHPPHQGLCVFSEQGCCLCWKGGGGGG